MPRPPTTTDEANRIIRALVERRFDGELPDLSTATHVLDKAAHLSRRPLAEVVPLHGRALFSAGSLSTEAREHAANAREDFFGELGRAVGVSARVLLAAVRARKFPLVPPRVLDNYEYLGAFTSTGQFDVADPCHLRKTSRMPAEVFSLSYSVAVEPGTWHAFVRNGDDRTAELAVIHADGFDVVASEFVATIGVDAGTAGVFDKTCPVPVLTELRVEGTIQGLGVCSHSGYGDGMYPVFAGRSLGVITKLRLAFMEEHPEVDATMPRRPSQRYAASTTFALGDTIEHVKFGAGQVVHVHDGKIDVVFAEDLRTLVHGKR